MGRLYTAETLKTTKIQYRMMIPLMKKESSLASANLLQFVQSFVIVAIVHVIVTFV